MTGSEAPSGPIVGVTLRDVLRGPLVVLAAAVSAGILLFLLVSHRESKRDAFDASVKTLTTLAFALSEHVGGTFNTADQMLKAVRHVYTNNRAELGHFFQTNNASVDRASFPLEAMIRADGMMYLSSASPHDLIGAASVNLSDRSHFQAQLSGTEDRVFVSQTIIGRVSGRPVLNMSRRVTDQSGRLTGVAVVSVSPDNFVAPYRKIVGDTGVVAIYGSDGIARVRITKDRTEGAIDISGTASYKKIVDQRTGYFVATSSADNVKRLYAYQALKDFPLFVLVGFGLDELETHHASESLARWQFRFGLALIGVTGLMILAVWSQVLRIRLERSNVALISQARIAARANEAKTRFLAGVSHELRTPLHGIMGHAQLLSVESGDAAARESAGTILKSARHLRNIVDGLLDLAKAEAEIANPRREKVKLAALVAEVGDLHAVAAAQKGVQFDWAIREEIPEVVVTDPVALKQVLHNLIDNAIKFTAAGSVFVTVFGGAKNEVIFEVRDTGVGIPDDVRADLFEPYSRSTKSTDGRTRGSGLGLALAARLVRSLGGSIAVESRIAEGTTFRFSIRPMDDVSDGSEEPR